MKRLSAALIIASLLIATVPMTVSADETQDIPTNAANTGNHNSLVAALNHVNLTSVLEGTGPFTVFAPTDAAFTAAGVDLNDFDTDAENDTLRDILLYHVFSGSVPASAVTDGMEATMANGDNVTFTVAPTGAVSVQGANVTTADVNASNGIIHVIDQVLLPPVDTPATPGSFVEVASSTGVHTLLVEALNVTGLGSELSMGGNFTVFAPTDAAFGAAGVDLAFIQDESNVDALAYILANHVVEGVVMAADVTDGTDVITLYGALVTTTVANGAVSIAGATVTTADVATDNGVIHVVDAVFTLPSEEQTMVNIILREGDTNNDGEITWSEFVAFVADGDEDYAESEDAMISMANFNQSDADSNGMLNATELLTFAALENSDLVDIPATAQSTGVHTALVAALSQAGLVETLQGDGPFTVFAPTDAAFQAAGIDLASFDTPEENATLADILLYHVYSGAVASSAVTDGLSVNMVNGDEATFSVANGVVSIGGANVTTADVATTNGVIHVIDKVLMPPAGDICYNMVSHTIVVGASNIECNSYMYVENFSMMGQTITGCYNTVTHMVSNVSEAICAAYMWTPAVNLAMTASATTIHTSLVAALAAAGLVETVSGTADYTVFAPSDDAFTAAGIDLDAFTTTEEIAVLADILLYHVVPGTTLSTDLTEGSTTVVAANGDNLTIQVTGTSVMVGTANVTLADVPASNGVIHVIDQVLMPPADEPTTVDPFEGVTCAETIGIGPSGYAFSPSLVNIDVGETVCWSWTDSSMPHNVKEVDGYQSSTYVTNGVTSGEAMTTVNFHHTFTEDTTFYYACEPHIGLNMFGEIVVGDGGDDVGDVIDTVKEDAEDTPGFVMTSALIALVGAVLLTGRRTSDTDE